MNIKFWTIFLTLQFLLFNSFLTTVQAQGTQTPTPTQTQTPTPTPNQNQTPTPSQNPEATPNSGSGTNLVGNFEQPSGNIGSKITTLPSIVVSGLTPSWEYKILLSGEWDGDEVSLNGNDKFMADSSGKISVYNLCDNGEAGRIDCEDTFKDGAYTIRVYQLNGVLVANNNFSVDKSGNLEFKTPKDETPDPDKEVSTGFGIVSTDPKQLVNTVLTIAIGIAGGVAFLLIVYGGFRLAFSQGDPKAVQEAREIITSAIVGLLLVIFSVFLLNLIGIDILGLPIGD